MPNLDSIPFDSEHPNFDIWTWVQSITALHMRILREQNQLDKVEEYRPRLTVQYEGEAKLLRRILNGSLLYIGKIKAYESEGDEKSANTWRFLQVNKLSK
jgi:hypothetical protein